MTYQFSITINSLIQFINLSRIIIITVIDDYILLQYLLPPDTIKARTGHRRFSYVVLRYEGDTNFKFTARFHLVLHTAPLVGFGFYLLLAGYSSMMPQSGALRPYKHSSDEPCQLRYRLMWNGRMIFPWTDRLESGQEWQRLSVGCGAKKK
jgi:hypothetical protein